MSLPTSVPRTYLLCWCGKMREKRSCAWTKGILLKRWDEIEREKSMLDILIKANEAHTDNEQATFPCLFRQAIGFELKEGEWGQEKNEEYDKQRRKSGKKNGKKANRNISFF